MPALAKNVVFGSRLRLMLNGAGKAKFEEYDGVGASSGAARFILCMVFICLHQHCHHALLMGTDHVTENAFLSFLLIASICRAYYG